MSSAPRAADDPSRAAPVEASAAELSTLVGIATGTPDGGVAIVRVSGPRAHEIVGRVLAGVGAWPAPPRMLCRRRLALATGLEDPDSARKYLSTLAALDFNYRDVAQRLDKLGAAKDNSAAESDG